MNIIKDVELVGNRSKTMNDLKKEKRLGFIFSLKGERDPVMIIIQNTCLCCLSQREYGERTLKMQKSEGTRLAFITRLSDVAFLV